MSSLAGALDPPSALQETKYQPPLDDVAMGEPALGSENGHTDVTVKDEDMHDLFGEAEDNDVHVVTHDEVATPASSEHAEHLDGLSSPERRHREAMEYAEEDEEGGEPIVEQVLEANAAIPNIPVPRSSDGNYWVIRMPNFVKVDSKPFHPDTYIGPEQEDEEAQQAESVREKSMTIKLKVENTVRWRWVKDKNGQDRRQSNSRIVRWSDGTLSLQLGKELFDITQTIDTSGAIPRQSFGSSQQPSQTAIPSSQTTPGKSQGLTYLVAQHKRAEILQCEALITGYMSLRPTGMQSETHRMLVRAVGQKHNKVARLRMAPDPTMDPEREKLELMRQAARKPRKPRGEDDGLGGPRRRRTGYTRKRSGEDMWSEDEEEGVFGGRSEDEYGEEGASGRVGRKRKAGGHEESSKKGPGEYQTDDFLVADSDEEVDAYGESDEEANRRKSTRRSRVEEEEGEEDDLERLEAQLNRQEEEERKRKRVSSGKSQEEGAVDEGRGEEGMDVESEEEDDEFGVRRRTTSGGRKRRAVGFDEEEE
ncbi:Leo1-domain-containing protein [Laetiporus sulphureus 93-53]|uniref:Leo1-domain-containing protein n=1 Tax=Laetiporus sulphureus 93-53 TaxID=1314785 RepID=A0A165BMS7_9APHY|nr:Leo1-domain-containing protein [Laetiporus sulphureus 93-53]KZT01324.1 Leo1-domain-containing protein [Laetiporus sulphureus 93-53]